MAPFPRLAGAALRGWENGLLAGCESSVRGILSWIQDSDEKLSVMHGRGSWPDTQKYSYSRGMRAVRGFKRAGHSVPRELPAESGGKMRHKRELTVVACAV